jgi:acetyl-CoA acetyltransferase
MASAIAVIVEAVRTPVGKRGALSGVYPAELPGGVQAALLDRAGLPPAEVEQVGRRVREAGGRLARVMID